MRVGLVRNAGLGAAALIVFGFAACDDSPTDFEPSETVALMTNPSVMVVPAGITQVLESRTVNQGNEPTWEEINPTIDASCGSAAITVAVSSEYEGGGTLHPVRPPGIFDVTGGTTLGETCITLSGGGQNATVEVTVVGDSLDITGAPDTLNLNSSVQLGAVLRADDGTPVTPFDPTTDLVWSSDNEDVLTVDQTGLVTAVGVGQAIITAVWSNLGVNVSASVVINTNQPTLEILGAADEDTLFVETEISRDLSAELINPTDPPADFGPFDPDTDVTWSSSDTTVVAVDAVTGVITAVGPGTATITATWTGNDDVFDEVEITVSVPPPTLTSTDVLTADALVTVTITGTDFLPGFHSVFLDGAVPIASYPSEVVDGTTATFVMPGGGAGDVEVTVGTTTEPSNPLTVVRTCGTLTDCLSEPDNDSPFTAPLVVLPFSATGIVAGDDLDDFYRFDLAVETTMQMDLAWTGDSGDLDLYVVDAGFTAFQCDFVTATASVPESGQCTLPAGEYAFWVNSFDEELAEYQLDITVVP